MQDRQNIYGLEDPRDGLFRYVGRTARSVERRLHEHITITYERNVELVEWIAALKALGLSPIPRDIDSAPDKAQAIEREQLWIRWYRAQGHPLLNGKYGPSDYPPKRIHKPPFCLPEMSEQKLLQIAAQAGERPQVVIERLLAAEVNRIRARADNLPAVKEKVDI